MSAKGDPPRLRRGDLLPRIVTSPPGPAARQASRALARYEAPGINTLYGDDPNILWQEARGANVLDVDGNRYVDFTAGFGVAAIGHRHSRVLRAIDRQSRRLVHGLGDACAHPLRVELAEELCRLAPQPDPRVYFAVSGADAVEIALKTAILATGRPEVVVFEPSYHGLTPGALAASSRHAFRSPFTAHLHDRLHRLPFGCKPSQLAALLDRSPAIGHLLVEPIVGREGVLVPPEGWLAAVAQTCTAHQVLLTVDEVFTGFGRLGSYFACQQEGVVPDLVCCGKALGGGLPIAAVLGKHEVMEAWRQPGEARHTATFVAHPLAMASALATLKVLSEERLVERAAKLGELLAPRLLSWSGSYPILRAVRGRGLLWGLELDDRQRAADFSTLCRRQGLLILAGGAEGRVAQLVPPLNISERQLEAGLEIVERVLHDLSARAEANRGSQLEP